MGIRARHVYALTFGIAAGLAGMAGAMVGTVGTFNPAAAGGFTLLSFVIAVLGGLGNMYGALVGGLVIGLVAGLERAVPARHLGQRPGLPRPRSSCSCCGPRGWSAGPSTPSRVEV